MERLASQELKVPVRNIFFLLAYAWNYWREAAQLHADRSDYQSMQELFARILANGVGRLMKKGLQRDFVAREEELRGIRGKVQLTASVRGMLFQQGKAACRYDELSVDIPPNRILKGTIRRLLRHEGIGPALKSELRKVYRLMGGIRLIEPRKRDFEEMQVPRHERLYGFLLQVCRFIHDQSGVDERTGAYEFRDILRDENQMPHLFEEFLRNFYRQHLTQSTVGRETIPWDQDEGSASSSLPQMHTDISVKGPDRYWIIDAKYYKNALEAPHRGEENKVRSENLYQLFAYLKNAETRNKTEASIRGMLLYPAVSHRVDEHFSLQGHPVRVKTVDLDRDWRAIEEELRGLLKG